MPKPLLKPTKPIPKAQRRWVNTNLAGARFQDVNLSGAKIRGAMLVDVDLDGYVQNLTVNGVDIGPLIDKELDRLHPERKVLKAAGKDPKSMRKAWSVIEDLWAGTMKRAQKLPEPLLHERVDGEWSLTETLRHLVFATDAWIGRTVLGEQNGFWSAGLAHQEMPPWFVQACRLDTKAKPTYKEVKEARADRMAKVRTIVDGLTLAELDRRCKGNRAKGYPTDPKKYTVRTCLGIVLSEEWEHHRYAERDLAALTG